MKHDITIGCDPEFFLYDTEKFHYVSAHDKIPGTKDAPYKLKHGACQADGTAVEFNIDPAKTAEEFEHNITAVLKQIREMIPKRYKFTFQNTVVYPIAHFNTIPAESKKLGCDPDFNAYALAPNKAPQIPDCVRTASGHIHVGWGSGLDTSIESQHFRDSAVLSTQLDDAYKHIVYNLDPNPAKRLQYYGANAAFRPKPYGMEFRVPSCNWLNNSKGATVMFNMTSLVYEMSMDGKLVRNNRYLFSNYLDIIYSNRHNLRKI